MDVVSAREQKEQVINLALAYEAEAQQMMREAEGFKQARVAQAVGDSSRFLSVLKEYQQAKDVTRTRLYLEAMGAVLPNIQKYIVDANAGGSLLQLLPLQGQASLPPTQQAPASVPAPVLVPAAAGSTTGPSQ